MNRQEFDYAKNSIIKKLDCFKEEAEQFKYPFSSSIYKTSDKKPKSYKRVLFIGNNIVKGIYCEDKNTWKCWGTVDINESEKCCVPEYWCEIPDFLRTKLK